MNTSLLSNRWTVWLCAATLLLAGCSRAEPDPDPPPTAELHDAGMSELAPGDDADVSAGDADPDGAEAREPTVPAPAPSPSDQSATGGPDAQPLVHSDPDEADGLLSDPRPLEAPLQAAQEVAPPSDGRSPAEIAAERAFAAPEDAKKLSPDARLWVDTERGRVIVDGYVTLREGPLEMFACPVGTKEHESIVSVLSQARYVHAALLAIGAMPGTPVSFSPEYRPATGQRIAIWVMWRNEQGEIQKTQAQQWVQETGTEGILKTDWVFAGSSFWTDPATGKEYYQADSGDLVCVSNFSTAMLDLPVESTQSNAALQYSAFTEKIPPRGTPVRLVFVPIPLPSDDPAPAAEDRADPRTPPEDALLTAQVPGAEASPSSEPAAGDE